MPTLHAEYLTAFRRKEAGLRSQYICQEHIPAIRRRSMNGQGERFARQCEDCGKFLGWVKADTLSYRTQQILQDYDEGLEARRQEELAAALQEARERIFADQEKAQRSRSTEWWTRYKEYLASEAWAEKRRLVLKRENYRCQGCYWGRATQIHHLTYEHVFNEFLWELAAACEVCHERAHPELYDGRAEWTPWAERERGRARERGKVRTRNGQGGGR